MELNNTQKHKCHLKGGSKVDDKLKLSYVAPSLKIAILGSSDVITTSETLWNDGAPDSDDDGWT